MTIRRIRKRTAAACPPTFEEEQRLHQQGYRFVAGIDEVGRGAIAGPVAAAAIILPMGISSNSSWLSRVRDSKQLSPASREALSPRIQEIAIASGVGLVSPEDIDVLGIVEATRRAMRRAVEQLPNHPDFLLIDAVSLPEVVTPQKALIHGDQLSLSIACASIVAKVTRDHIMEELDGTYPGYGFARHKGYGTQKHISSLQKLGPSRVHRLSFAPVRAAIALSRCSAQYEGEGE